MGVKEGFWGLPPQASGLPPALSAPSVIAFYRYRNPTGLPGGGNRSRNSAGMTVGLIVNFVVRQIQQIAAYLFAQSGGGVHQMIRQAGGGIVNFEG